jgi:hypothetical protein
MPRSFILGGTVQVFVKELVASEANLTLRTGEPSPVSLRSAPSPAMQCVINLARPTERVVALSGIQGRDRVAGALAHPTETS